LEIAGVIEDDEPCCASVPSRGLDVKNAMRERAVFGIKRSRTLRA